MKLSIIIPVYNLERYLSKCLDSILHSNASTAQYEIVAINDGSTDESLPILNAYARKYSNMVVVDQPNQGVSVARNVGIENSQGDYITFVDGDDYIYRDGLEKVLNELAKYSDADVFYAEKETIEDNVLVSRFSFPEFDDSILYNTEEIRSIWYINGGSMCSGFYRKSLFSSSGIFFSPIIKNGEDTLLCYRLLTMKLCIRFIKLPFYVINIRIGSASRSASVSKVIAFGNNINYIVDVLKSNPHFSREQIGIMHQAAYHMFGNAVAMFSHTDSMKFTSFINSTGIKKLLPLDIRYTNPIFKNKIRLLNASPYLFTILGYLLHKPQRQV